MEENIGFGDGRTHEKS